MKLIELTSGSGRKIAVLPTGGLVIEKLNDKDPAMTKVLVLNLGWNVTEPYEQVVANFNAELEQWK